MWLWLHRYSHVNRLSIFSEWLPKHFRQPRFCILLTASIHNPCVSWEFEAEATSFRKGFMQQPRFTHNTSQAGIQSQSQILFGLRFWGLNNTARTRSSETKYRMLKKMSQFTAQPKRSHRRLIFKSFFSHRGHQKTRKGWTAMTMTHFFTLLVVRPISSTSSRQ